jgi:hypothetical protein
MMFMEGQSIGHIGLECINSTSYDATDSVCGPNGAIIDSDAIYTCPETNPNCVQCGERGIGAALCLDTTEVPSYCFEDGVATTSPASSPTASEESGCLVGDIMYEAGDNIGHIGLECLNSTSYDATESVCGEDGNIEESNAVYTCPETSSYCVQCGERGIGAALCLDTTEVPSYCSSNSSTTAEITDETPGPAPATPTTESSPSTTSTAANTPSTMNSSVKNVASMGVLFAGSVFVYGVQSL